MDEVLRSYVGGSVCSNPGMSDLFRDALLYWALNMIIILLICYLKPGLVIKTNKLFIHSFLFHWCPKITGSEKIYEMDLNARSRLLKERRSIS